MISGWGVNRKCDRSSGSDAVGNEYHLSLLLTFDLSAPRRSSESLTFNELKDAHWLFDTPGIMKENDVSQLLPVLYWYCTIVLQYCNILLQDCNVETAVCLYLCLC